uniref:Neurotransmitter-gated ion-channel ligand-binding domain-containing protein n=1 Tax=Anopheles farauti TaxID=69004 RepID=A0A182QGX1_9DIPT
MELLLGCIIVPGGDKLLVSGPNRLVEARFRAPHGRFAFVCTRLTLPGRCRMPPEPDSGCHNMGVLCESAQLQHRPVRSDRNRRRSWSTEQLQLGQPRIGDIRQPQAATGTTTTSHSPPSWSAPDADDGSSSASTSTLTPLQWHCAEDEETPRPDVTLDAGTCGGGKRRRGAEVPTDAPATVHRWTNAFFNLPRPTPVLDGYSTLVLEKLSRFIGRHVAVTATGRPVPPRHATCPLAPASPCATASPMTRLSPSSSGEPVVHQLPNGATERRPGHGGRTEAPPHRAESTTQFHARCPTRPRDAAVTAASRPATSHHLVRHSLCLYAASSVLLALCYLTIPTVASDTAHPIFAEGKSDKEILDHLLKNSRYDKRLLPPVDGTLTVNVSVLLLSLASPDESSLKYEVEFLLQQQWFDPRLRYANQSQYEYLNAIHHHEDIWLPDTYFIMHGDFKDPIIPMHFALRIYRNGTINYLMRRHLILSCQGRLNIFPFDDPLCSFALESISYEQSAITYVWKNDEDTLRKSPSLTTLNAYLIQNQTIACPIKASWRGNYSCLKVDLIFTRDRAFYFTTVFIPGIILVTSSFITFWLEWNAVPARSMIDLMFTRDRAFYFTTVFIPGIILVTSSFITFWLEWNAVPARVMIGVTTMLNFFTTSNGFRSTLPVVSNLTAMNVWDGVCMCFIYASLLEFVCVNYVGRKRPLHNVVYRPGENPVTQRLPAVLSRIGIILASPLETIDREFHTAIAAEKTTPGTSAGTAAATAATAAPAAGRIAAQAQQQPHRNLQPVPSPPTAARATAAASATPIANASAAQARVLRCEEGLSAVSEPGSVEPAEGLTHRRPTVETRLNEAGLMETSFGVKKRESGGPNEIVACTSCAGGTSPCTHSANNGCATETCFVQVRKKEPPHPIRVAKTIDVIARITFPSAYAVFLIFFFIHYKGFS